MHSTTGTGQYACSGLLGLSGFLHHAQLAERHRRVRCFLSMAIEPDRSGAMDERRLFFCFTWHRHSAVHNVVSLPGHMCYRPEHCCEHPDTDSGK
jgi:hypothetical protein